MSKNLTHLAQQFVKYGLVGILNSLVHFIVYWLLLAFAGATMALANLAGFAVAVCVSYFVNARFTFRARPRLSRLFRMYVIMGALSFISGALGDKFAADPIVVFVLYCAASYAAGFVLTKLFVFTDSKPRTEADSSNELNKGENAL